MNGARLYSPQANRIIPRIKLYNMEDINIEVYIGFSLNFLSNRKGTNIDINTRTRSKGSHRFIDISQTAVGLAS